MVIPVWKEGSVGDRKAYAHLFAFFNSVMWTLYASTDLPSTLLFSIISGMGIVVHFFYINFYIYFADGKKRVQTLGLSFTFCDAAFIMAELVASMVLISHRWSSTFVHVFAAVSGASTQIVPTYDLVIIVMNYRQINNINPIIMAVISLFSACTWTVTWTPYGFMSVPVNPYVVVPNLIGILSAAAQIVVYSYLLLPPDLSVVLQLYN
ncbi:bidirectional sugar transporter SWEET4-like [Triticum dicoccoides]|uniref:bidirectional sugar transporter SWEET4-like n=1 Tax=Triticum dicoccoides TaxID=85692 RepID=UPI00188E76FC|nr:bidirectional sugar transporter SWEET4-like [Triticum dicoccoides]